MQKGKSTAEKLEKNRFLKRHGADLLRPGGWGDSPEKKGLMSLV